MKILLCAVNSKFSHTNLAIRLLSRFCGYSDCEILEFTINEPINFVVSEIYKKCPDIICFSSYIWNIEFIIKCAETLKSILPEAKLVLGGPEVSYCPDEYIAYPFIDAVLCGEGELTFKTLCENRFNFCDVDGVVYRHKNSVIHNAPANLLSSLDELPFPYTDTELSELRGKLLYYESSRGCPYSCSYCLSSVMHSLRFASFDKVKKDLKYFIDKNVKIVKFIDRTFNADDARAYKIFEFLIQHGGNTRFHFEISAHILTERTLALLSTAPKGLFQFEIGVQSTNENTISAINRKTNFDILSRNVSKLLSFGNIHLHLDLIAGLPYENLDSFINSFNMVFALRPDMLQLGFLKLLKGTKIRNEYQLHGYKFISYPPYEFLENKYMSFTDTLVLKDIENITEKYYNSGKFVKTIECLLTFFPSPFDMFSAVSEYFKSRGCDKISVSQSALYEILAAFIKKHDFPEYLLDCLKFDYFFYAHANNSPSWYIGDYSLSSKRFDIIEKNRKNIFARFGTMPAKEIVKQVIFEEFKYDIFDTFKCKKQLIVFFKNGGFEKMDLTPKDYIIKKIEGEYAVLKNIEDNTELFIALALLPPETDVGLHLHYENLEYTVS